MPKTTGTTLSGRDWLEAVAFWIVMGACIIGILGLIYLYREIAN